MTTHLLLTREEIEDKLAPLWHARQLKNAATKEDNLLSEPIKQWGELNWDSLDIDERGHRYIADPERGFKAWFETKKNKTWDLRTAPPEVVLALAAEGLLDVRDKEFTSARTAKPSLLLDMAVKYRQEGETVSLRIEKKE